MKLIRLALNVPLARFFDYLLPEEISTEIGVRAVVPFGRQTKIGIVVDLPIQSNIPSDKLKPITAVLDQQSLFDDEIWQLLNWAANYYHAPLGEVLMSALPVKLRNGESSKRTQPDYFVVTDIGRNVLLSGELARAKKQQLLLETLAQFAHFFEKPTACAPSVWKGLMEKGYIKKIEIPYQAVSWQQKLANQPICNRQNRLTLNKQQSLVVGRLNYHEGFGAFLLNGVTGSGKTEVYLQVIEEILNQGKQVLVLVPEIGLTPQTIHRFKARFNVEIDALHSNLNDNQRLNAWLRAKNGESAIVIGTRSALFTQFHKLGLIIIDEEHDSSFKQQDGWRYHARDLAVLRARNANIPIILGSATPSLESVQNVQNGKFIELQLSQRAGGANNVKQQVIDLKTQRIYSGLSEQLLAKMQHHLEKGNQVMLFLNRRGFAPVLLCHECGWICQCEACDKPYTYHQKSRILRCHHCASQRVIPRQCGHCGSTHLITTGMGTEQLEHVLTERFPQFAISRIDRDSTARKGSLEQHLTDIQAGKSQILIGTQMLAKGHHFPNVTLVAIVNVDSSLFSTDFRAEERLAQLYLQVAGRAGRAEKQGEVVLQTHYPEHPLLKTLLNEGYLAFSIEALKMRKVMNLPPFSAQVLIRATGRDNDKVAEFLHNLTACLQTMIQDNQWQGFQILGAFSAPMAKKAGHYRWQSIIQHSQRTMLQKLLSLFDEVKTQFLRNDIRLTVDIDPQDVI
ncbi:primosomal protein N' [Bibersteinia trehalosi]|uniref:Replication restart protein PriA n=1 Tax=Bibersteinia trehalosi TaxID=47735 RepID=A0A3R8LER5_BIBTR|nr:primosomal protein N' [Bibersteinia trehalosi]RRN03401.1 primosomal protein N' [Bibersteinia trehalosi]